MVKSIPSGYGPSDHGIQPAFGKSNGFGGGFGNGGFNGVSAFGGISGGGLGGFGNFLND